MPETIPKHSHEVGEVSPSGHQHDGHQHEGHDHDHADHDHADHDHADHDHADHDDHDHDDHDHAASWMEWARVGFVAVVLLIVWSGVVPRPGGIDWVALVGIAIGGYPIFKEAIADLLKGRMTMELSMTIALAAAAGIGEFFTALLITLFVLVAEIIEGMTVGRGRGAIRQLLDLLPHDVEVRSDGQVAPRTLADVHVGDVVLVRPGGHIPVDGVVISGNSFVDQATITGESMPAEKMAGSRVFAGTINQSGVLEIHTDKIGADTAFGRIIEAVERAERSRAPIEKIADRLAGYLVYFA
jgi:cation transport ATPase